MGDDWSGGGKPRPLTREFLRECVEMMRRNSGQGPDLLVVDARTDEAIRDLLAPEVDFTVCEEE